MGFLSRGPAPAPPTAAELDPNAHAVAQPGGAASSSRSDAQAATAAQPKTDILLQVPVCEVHKVVGNTDTLAARGSLVAYGVQYPSGEQRLALEVHETRWWLLPDTATLKVAPLSYMIALPDNQTFHMVTFAEDTLPEAVGAFEGLLEEITVYKKSDALVNDPALAQGDFAIAEGLKFSNKGASLIHSASCRVAGGILMAADAASKKMLEHHAKVQAGSEPVANPRPLPAIVKLGASATKTGTKGVAKAADLVVNAVASVPVWVADRVVGSKPGAEPKPQSAGKQIVTASAVSFTVVWESMESGARMVLLGARDSASGIAHHKYGPDAGTVTKDTLSAAGHAANAYTSYRNIAVRAIARKTAKTTAKRMLYSYLGKDAAKTGQDFKKLAKQNVQAQAKQMRRMHSAPPTHEQSRHHAMLQSFNSSLAERSASTRPVLQTAPDVAVAAK